MLSGEVLCFDHPHSHVSIRLRHRYRELRDIREHRYFSFLGLMSVYAHPRASLSSANDALRDRIGFALSAIPYYNVGDRKSGASNGMDAAVRLFKKIRENVTDEMITTEIGETESD